MAEEEGFPLIRKYLILKNIFLASHFFLRFFPRLVNLTQRLPPLWPLCASLRQIYNASQAVPSGFGHAQGHGDCSGRASIIEAADSDRLPRDLAR